MFFRCAHCNKEIKEVSIVIDKRHIIHKSCEDEYKKERLINKLEASGLLDDVKTPISDEIDKLFECSK
jgi:hypothetical protein